MDQITCVVDNIGVITRAAAHGVRTRSAVQAVVSAIANKDVVEFVAGAVDDCSASEGQVLDVGRQLIVDGRLDRVGAFVGIFIDHVTRAFYDVGVIAKPTDHHVNANTPIYGVMSTAPPKFVIARPAIQGIMPITSSDFVAGTVSLDDITVAISRQEKFGVAVAV